MSKAWAGTFRIRARFFEGRSIGKSPHEGPVCGKRIELVRMQFRIVRRAREDPHRGLVERSVACLLVYLIRRTTGALGNVSLHKG